MQAAREELCRFAGPRYLMHKVAGSENLAEFDYLVASSDHHI